MSWLDRVEGSIKFTSPNGDEYEASWIKNPVGIEKKLAISEYPDVDGTVLKDLGIVGRRYPLTFLFSGADNDLEAIRFMGSMSQRGAWTIIHPVLGELLLQPAELTPSINPTETGNITVIESEWIEGIDLASLTLSTPQIAAQIETQGDQLDSTSSDQFVANSVQDTANEISTIESTVNQVTGIITDKLSPLYESSSELNAQILSITRGIQDTITQSTIDVSSLSGQIQSLITLPLLATNDIIQRLAVYGEALSDLLLLKPIGVLSEDKNIVSVQELAGTAILKSMSQIAATGILQTRAQTIEVTETLSSSFLSLINNLDETQKAFEVKSIDLQYFSESSAFSDLTIIVAQATAYLLLASFDLAIEKIITLEKQRAPIEITITEYGTLGDGDKNFDLFLESNNLKDNDIIILPAGREVVVYV